MKKRVLIAMSGGVDSSVTAYLLAEQGFECIGVTMKLFAGCDKHIEDASSAAKALGIAHHVFDLSNDFSEHVINPFISAYRSGTTPNPCIYCNRHIKFGRLLSLADKFGAGLFATGHYARVEQDTVTGRWLLKKASDASKDQSYFLYTLTQQQLSRTILPLGIYTKRDVRTIAAKHGFVKADKHESQDICFVPGRDYAGFIEQYTGKASASGDFVDLTGKTLGRHNGLIRYTTGQRKGLGIALAKPMYVHSKDIDNNTVTLCKDDELYSRELDAADFNWINCERPEDSPVRAKAKIRYRHTEQWATAAPCSAGNAITPSAVHIMFDEPQRAIAKGQAVVLYDGDTVIGGGTIV